MLFRSLPEATGRLEGLTNATTPAQIALAAHDGVLCSLLDGVDALSAAGASLSGRLFLVGGGARSAAYRRRLADLSSSPIVVPDVDEAVATGAALQAAVVVDGADPAAIAARWDLGAGTTIDPEVDARPLRRAWTAARDRVAAAL